MNTEDIKKIAREEFMNNVMKHLGSALIFAYIQNLENQLQQKENIIKEVREYIEKHQCCDGKINVMTLTEYKELLEILDKGE